MSITIYPSQFNMREDDSYEQLPAIKGGDGAQGPPGVGALPGGVAGQVPVKQSADDYDVAWEDIEWVLVWTNADTSSDFVAQTVSIDLSGYTEVYIAHGWKNDGYPQYSYLGRVGDQSNLMVNQNIKAASGVIYLCRRQIEITSTGIVFADCYKKATNTTGSGTMDNAASVPYSIYAR